MPGTQNVTVNLTNPDEDEEVKITGSNLDDDLGNSVHKNDTQIVQIFDGGDLADDDASDGPATFIFEQFGKTTGDADEFHIDLSGFDDDFNIAVKSQDPGDTWYFTGFDSYVRAGDVWTFTYTGTDGSTHTVSIDTVSTNGTGVASVVVCFVRGTQIETPDGTRLIEDLKAGDAVLCGDGQTRDIQWIGSRLVTSDQLDAGTSLRPVVFAPGALGEDKPNAELRLSPQHRVLLRDWKAELLFGSHEVLAPAISLLNDKDILRDHTCEEVEYFHILLDGHQTVIANGVECESLMPADMAISALDSAAREEIFVIFPDLAADLANFGPASHRILKPYEQKVLGATTDRSRQ